MLIGTAVVGATTMIFSIIMALTGGLTDDVQNLSLLHAPFMLGLISGGAMIYWFTGASTQAVTTGAYRAVEFIKANIKLEGVEKASVADSKRVVEICTQHSSGKSIGVTLPIILGFSLVGIAGSYGVAWFGIRVNTFANSRTAFAALRGKPYPAFAIPLAPA